MHGMLRLVPMCVRRALVNAVPIAAAFPACSIDSPYAPPASAVQTSLLPQDGSLCVAVRVSEHAPRGVIITSHSAQAFTGRNPPPSQHSASPSPHLQTPLPSRPSSLLQRHAKGVQPATHLKRQKHAASVERRTSAAAAPITPYPWYSRPVPARCAAAKTNRHLLRRVFCEKKRSGGMIAGKPERRHQ